MRTRLQSTAILLSLFLCLTCIIFWALSSTGSYQVGWARSHWTATTWYRSNYFVGIANGQFCLNFGHSTIPMATPDSPNWKTYTPNARQRFVRFQNDRPEMAGWLTLSEPHSVSPEFLKNSLAAFECLRPVGLDIGRIITIPTLLPILLLAIPPAHWLKKRTRKNPSFPTEQTPLPA